MAQQPKMYDEAGLPIKPEKPKQRGNLSVNAKPSCWQDIAWVQAYLKAEKGIEASHTDVVHYVARTAVRKLEKEAAFRAKWEAPLGEIGTRLAEAGREAEDVADVADWLMYRVLALESEQPAAQAENGQHAQEAPAKKPARRARK